MVAAGEQAASLIELRRRDMLAATDGWARPARRARASVAAIESAHDVALATETRSRLAAALRSRRIDSLPPAKRDAPPSGRDFAWHAAMDDAGFKVRLRNVQTGLRDTARCWRTLENEQSGSRHDDSA
jgi:hypothetical protein